MSNSNSNLRVHVLAAATAVALAALAAPVFAGQAYVTGLKADGKYDRFIVKYKNDSAPTTSTAALASSLNTAASRTLLPAGAKGKRAGLKHLRRMALGADVVTSDAALNGTEAAALIRQIAADPNVEWVQSDFMVQALAVPNDPLYPNQWHYADDAVGIRAPIAWNSSTGAGVVVAVIDSGILSHNDLNANVLPGYDFITSVNGSFCPDFTTGCGASNDGNGRDSDPNDASNIVHGTHVAGTIAAVANNSLGLAGVAYNAKVVPIRVLGGKGYGNGSDTIDAITWASGGTVSGVPANANPAEVINMSLGGIGACSPAEQAAINGAVARGVVVIAAAGNFNNDVAENSPASCANVISVAASDRGGRRAFYSTYGATIDVTAPGGEVCSPATEHLPLGARPGCATPIVVNSANAVWSTIEGNGYAGGQWHGTSMAAPHVAAVAALIQSVSATPKTPAQIEQILESTARPISAANCPGGCGAGIIDAAAAVAAASGGVVNPPVNAAPVANFSSSANGLTVAFTDSSTDSDGTIASRSWSFGDGTNSTSANPSKTYTAAGTYTVTLTVTDNQGATNTKTSSVTVSSSSSNVRQTYTNGTDVTINDNLTVESTITVAGRSGNAPADTALTVDIVHTFRGDLIVDLVAPDGSSYRLANRQGTSGGINKTITVPALAGEALNGIWTLRVEDAAAGDTGRINSWSLNF